MYIQLEKQMAKKDKQQQVEERCPSKRTPYWFFELRNMNSSRVAHSYTVSGQRYSAVMRRLFRSVKSTPRFFNRSQPLVGYITFRVEAGRSKVCSL